MENVTIYGIRLGSASEVAALLIEAALPAHPEVGVHGDEVTVARPSERVWIEWYSAFPEYFEAFELPDEAHAPCLVIHYREAYLGLLAEVLEVLGPYGELIDDGGSSFLKPSMFLARMRVDPGWWFREPPFRS